MEAVSAIDESQALASQQAREAAEVARLQAADRAAKARVTAQVEKGHPWAGPPVYTWTVGPDGKRYATGGWAPIDVKPSPGDARATAAKMRVVMQAALSPGAISAADLRAAAQATAQLADALAALEGQDGAVSLRL